MAKNRGGNPVLSHANRKAPDSSPEGSLVRSGQRVQAIRLLKMHRLLGVLALAIWAIGANFEPAWAQESAPYPNRLIRIVVPLPAGGNMDALSRVIAEKLSASVGQPVIIENKTGASGGIGASAVAQSKPDGYTILFAIASTIQAVGLQKNPPFKLSELAPITQLAELPTGFAVRADLQAGTLADFVKFAKEKPGDLSFGSVGSGSTGHIIGEGLANAAGIKLLHVPYKGEAPAITDLLGGHISTAFASVGGLGQYPDKVRLLAITGPHRLKGFPDVPTFQQLGYPLHGLTGWAGVFAPAATPMPIIDKLATEIGRIVRLPDVQAKILDFGFEPLGETTEPFAAFVNAQAERWAAAAKEAGIEPQ
jgi:tripartite-type tricarboxylate transporter receptor subunit TctC